MSVKGFASAAPHYRDAGWAPIPLKAGTKRPAVSGATGYAGTVTAAKIDDWIERFAANPVGVALDGVVSFDVDEYGDKHGAEQLAALEDELGALPRTFTSTARGADQPSRQHFYRVPSGVKLKATAAPDIEICRPGGNPSAVWPSVHPTLGTRYRWYGPNSERHDGVPDVADLPPLPSSWAERFAAPTVAREASTGDTLAVAELLARFTAGPACSQVRAHITATVGLDDAGHIGHPIAAARLLESMRLGLEGHRGAALAVEEVRARFEGYLTESRPREAAEELAGLMSAQAAHAQSSAVEQSCHCLSVTFALPAPPDGAPLLDEVRSLLERYVSFPSDDAAVAVTLWAAHTHLLDCFDSSPRLAPLSPEPASGKTRLLEILDALVHDSVMTANTSAAFLARRIGATPVPPTVLIDEVDTLYGTRSGDAAAEELRGILNSGHRRKGTFSRAAVRGKEVVLEEFPTFAAVALAGLGNLPDTIMTRSVVIRMRRRAPGESVAPFRERKNAPELHDARDRLAGWAKSVAPSIGNPWPEIPEGIEDRDEEMWEPLLAVAAAAGGHWPALAREAALALVTESQKRPATLGIRLLADVRRVLNARARIRSTDLLGELLALEESPWADLGGRGAIDSRYIARTLATYNIRAPHTVRFESEHGGTHKGWEARDFADAFARYLPEQVSTVEPFDE